MIAMLRGDQKFRKWHKPEAERRAYANEKKLQAEYKDRCNHLASFIAGTVKQRHVNGHLSAFDVWSLLLQLKEEVDHRVNGTALRQPWANQRSTEGQRSKFMSEAFNIAVRNGKVKIYRDPDTGTLWLYAAHTAPKWLVYRNNGQIIADYLPTHEELAIPEDVFDTSPEIVLTDRYRMRMQAWRQS
jgi:phage/plasmid-associated DNA primase